MTRPAFSLIEVLLSIALMALIGAISLPFYYSFQNRNDLDIAATTLAHTLRRAQTLAQAVEGDSKWGVSIQTGSIILFKGNDFASRDIVYDENYSFPGSINSDGLQEITFNKLTGNPTTSGSTTFTSPNNETKIITINGKGMVNY